MALVMHVIKKAAYAIQKGDKRGGLKMDFSKLKKYVHQDWNEMDKAKQKGEKHYFVKTNPNEMREMTEKLEKELEIEFPKDLTAFYENIGSGNLWFGRQDKIWNYNILEPFEIYDLYYPNDEEDLFVTYRLNAWDNLEEKLLAFCLMDEEDSLLYYSLNDKGIYLFPEEKIADSLEEFFELIDGQVDYFMEEDSYE